MSRVAGSAYLADAAGPASPLSAERCKLAVMPRLYILGTTSAGRRVALDADGEVWAEANGRWWKDVWVDHELVHAGLECNGCGRYVAGDTVGELLEVLKGWQLTEGDVHRCPDCAEGIAA